MGAAGSDLYGSVAVHHVAVASECSVREELQRSVCGAVSDLYGESGSETARGAGSNLYAVLAVKYTGEVAVRCTSVSAPSPWASASAVWAA